MDGITGIIIAAVVAGLVCFVVAFVLGSAYRKHKAEAKIGSAEEEAKRILSEAIKAAEAKKKRNCFRSQR